MAEQTEQIVVEIKFDTQLVDEAKSKIAAASTAIETLKAQQKELTSTIKEQGYATKEQASELAKVRSELESATRAQKSNTAVVQAATLAQYDSNASLDEQRQYLNTLQKAYASMDKGQMELLGGQQALAAQIGKVADSIKLQEMAIGDARRNVGNYSMASAEAVAQSHDLADAFKAAQLGSTGLGRATDSLDKTMKLAAKNPWMAVLTLLLPLLRALFDALKGNEQAMAEVKRIMDALKNAFKQFEPLIQKVAGLLTNVLGKAFEFITGAITQVLKGVDWLAQKLGFDLHLSAAFEDMAHGAQEAADVVEETNVRIVESETKKEDELQKLRDDMARRRRTTLENEIADLEEKKRKELEIAGTTAEEKLEIEDYYNKQIQDKRDAAAAEEARIAEEAEQQRLEARQKAREQFGIEEGLTPEQQELLLLQKAREDDLLNQEEYEYAKTLITEKYSKMRNDEIAAEVKKATDMYAQEMKTATGSAAAAMEALGELVGEFAENSEDAARAQKAFAMGSILINQAISIAEGAKGIAAAMAGAAEAAAATGPAAPIMLAVYQAQMVGQVLAMVASVASTIVQSKQVLSEANGYEHGGIVPGTSYTGDHVISRLNSGEGVLTRKGVQNTSELLRAVDDGSIGFNYEMFAAAMSAQPAPVVVYSELEEFGQKVSTFNEIASV